MARILRSSTLQWNAFQLFMPMGGVVTGPTDTRGSVRVDADAPLRFALVRRLFTNGPAGSAYLLYRAHCG
jgi:hypothetical protein